MHPTLSKWLSTLELYTSVEAWIYQIYKRGGFEMQNYERRHLVSELSP